MKKSLISKVMRPALASLLSMTAGVVQAAVNFTGPGRDVADSANWGGSLPGTTTAVAFPAAAIPAEGLILSTNVTFGATTFSSGHDGTIGYNLCGWTNSSASALTVNSDLCVSNGMMSMSAYTIAAAKTLTMSGAGSLLKSAGGHTLNNDSTLCITNGAVYRPGGSGFTGNADNALFLIADGAEYDASQMTSEYNIANVISGHSNFTWRFDHSRGTIYTMNWGGKSNGALTKVSDSSFEVLNGSDVFVGSTGSRPGGCAGNNGNGNSRGWRFGSASSASHYGKYSLRNKFIVRDSTFQFSTSQGHMLFAGTCDELVFSNATVNLNGRQIQVYGYTNAVTCIGSKFSSTTLVFTGSSMSNRLELADCVSSPALTINGTNNYARLSSSTNSTLTLGGYSNCVVYAGMKKTGDVTVSGAYADMHISASTTGVVTVSSPTAALSVTNSNVKLTLSTNTEGTRATVSDSVISQLGLGRYATLTMTAGASFACGGVNTTAFNFNNHTNTTIVLDNSTFDCQSFFGNKNSGNEIDPYTGCPGLTFEFLGDHPQLAISGYGSQRAAFASGTSSSAVDNPDGVTFSFVVPQTGYAAAPIRCTATPDRGANVRGNTKFAVRMAGNGELPEEELIVPIFYDAKAFKDPSGGNGARVSPAALTEFNRDRIPEGAEFVLSSDKKTLSIVIPHRKRGMVLIVR